MKALSDYDLQTLEDELCAWGYRPVHARRLLRAFYDGGGSQGLPGLARLELPAGLRARFGTDLALRQSRVLQRTGGADGTLKLLIGFDGGGAVEAVLMPSYRADRAAGCLSSQVGCAMGCDFCASTLHGLERNLTAGEIVEQFLHLRQSAGESGRRLVTLVFMGVGEPMHNLDEVLAAIRRIAAKDLGALGWRQITVSTVGIVPGIDRLAAADLNVNLAVSLHAPDDVTRAVLLPVARRYGVADIIAATRRFEERTGRPPTIQYCLLDGINDSDAQAHQLAHLLGGLRVHVNLIPYNAIGPGLSGRVYREAGPQRTCNFLDILRVKGVIAHCRRRRGQDVNAACGQLRHAHGVAVPR